MLYYTYLSMLCWAGTYLSTGALEHKLPTRIPQVSICYLLVTWDSTQCHQAGILFHFLRLCHIDHSVTLIWKPLHKTFLLGTSPREEAEVIAVSRDSFQWSRKERQLWISKPLTTIPGTV